MTNRGLVGAGVLVLLGAGIAAFVLVRGDDGGSHPSTTTSTTATATTTTTAPVASTATTPPTSVAATSSTTARAVTTTPPRANTTATAHPSTTVGAAAVCGSGTATVSFAAKDLTTDALSSTFVPQVTVDNQVSAPIEVEGAVIEVTYPGGEVRTVRFATAGTVIGPGTSASFTSDKLTSAQRYQSVRFTRFTYFTAGQKSLCTVTTP